MKQKKIKIAFVYSRPGLNSARMKYMPFGLSTLRLLAERKNIRIDFYVTETEDSRYETFLPSNVRVVYLNHHVVWSRGQGRSLYYLLNSYFSLLTLGKSYKEVWGNGQSGNVLASKLARRCGAKLFLLNDEFPDTSYLKVWVDAEWKALCRANVIIEPDETRFQALNQKIDGRLSKIKHYVLPNIPLRIAITPVSKQRNFKQELNIPNDEHIFMYAGGIGGRENNIEFVLAVFPLSPNDCHLVIVGIDPFLMSEQYNHPRIHWVNEVLSDEALHILIKQSSGSIAFYSTYKDLEYVGKSSGKIMRSLLFNTPVITSNFSSLEFIKTDGMGVLIDKPYQLAEAVAEVRMKKEEFQNNIQKNIHKYYFEKYWEGFISIEALI